MAELTGVLDEPLLAGAHSNEREQDATSGSSSGSKQASGGVFSRLLSAFNLKANARDVFARKPCSIDALDGVRAVGLLWILAFHCYKV